MRFLSRWDGPSPSGLLALASVEHAENASKELYSHLSPFHKSGEEGAPTNKKNVGPVKGQCTVSEDVSIITVLEIIVCLY